MIEKMMRNLLISSNKAIIHLTNKNRTVQEESAVAVLNCLCCEMPEVSLMLERVRAGLLCDTRVRIVVRY